MNKGFKIFTEPVAGEIVITENSQFNHVEAERIVVYDNVIARVFGTVKEVVLMKNACVYVHGRIIGHVRNEGGEIHIYSQG